ncbi:hypothetical protein [Chiayiivirga flava]|uniref:Uncharacterized protein n=1 Tax=Chiayiivirga flava TaxID=659595 RepID=A0A7W8D4P6_9GAMM|nr:hypothetical protein [Chiayiivirga flava]MBB5207869.1 hypothetical protein [Chiayiivirga flava]
MLKFVLSLLILSTSLHATESALSNAKTECENLMNTAVPFAEKMLAEHGEFFPYGQVLSPDGSIVAVAASTGSERPKSQTIIDLLKQGFAKGAKYGTYRATALVYDAKVSIPSSGEKSDAIAVELDHVERYSVVVYLPYSLHNGQITYGEVFAQRGSGKVFDAE